MDDHRQNYVEITKNCLGIEIADERLQFLQTKHLQCSNLNFHTYNAKMTIILNVSFVQNVKKHGYQHFSGDKYKFSSASLSRKFNALRTLALAYI